MLTVKKELENLHIDLEGMRFDLFDNYRVDLKEKFEIAARFIDGGLQDAISVIDKAIDRIGELEDELREVESRIDELERESA